MTVSVPKQEDLLLPKEGKWRIGMKPAQGKKRNHINLANELFLDNVFIAALQIPGDLSSFSKQYTLSKLYFKRKKKITLPNVDYIITLLLSLPLNFFTCCLERENMWKERYKHIDYTLLFWGQFYFNLNSHIEAHGYSANDPSKIYVLRSLLMCWQYIPIKQFYKKKPSNGQM